VKIEKYRLTSEGRLNAWAAKAESEGKELTLGLAFKYATDGKGILQYILANICIGICFPIRVIKRIFRS